MTIRSISALFFCASLAFNTGCENSRNEKKVYPIRGTFLFDGKPAEGLQIQFHDLKGTDTNQPTFPQATTDASGAIKVSTYTEGDGAPAGDYALTISWKEFSTLSRSYSGPDKLKQKYSDPKKTSVKLTVGGGTPNDLGSVELK